jgi:hypothetical protein
VESRYYSKSEISRGAVTVSFSKYLPWQAMHFLQRFTNFSKTFCKPFITWKFLAFLFRFHGWKISEIAWGRDPDCMADVLMGFYRSTFSKPNTEFNSDLVPMKFLGFSNHEKEFRGKKFRSDQLSAARFRDLGGAL